MSRFYAPPDSIVKDKIVLRGREAHHAKDVMRLKTGDEIVVFDGTGKEYTGVIEEEGKNELLIKINKIIEGKTDICRVALAQAIPKLDKMDFIIEKATELGVERIMPILTDRTIVKAGTGKVGSKIERWRKLAVAASKQSCRSTIPEIDDIAKFKDALVFARGYELAIIPCLSDSAESLKNILQDNKAKSAIIFIGPEGDFTQEEINAAKSNGIKPVSLGREVLRSDTAALSVISIVNYELRW